MKELLDKHTRDEIENNATKLAKLLEKHPEYNDFVSWLMRDVEVRPHFEYDSITGKKHCTFTGVLVEGKWFGIGIIAFAYRKMVNKKFIKKEFLSWLCHLSVVENGRLAYIGYHGNYRIIDQYEIAQAFIGFHCDLFSVDSQGHVKEELKN